MIAGTFASWTRLGGAVTGTAITEAASALTARVDAVDPSLLFVVATDEQFNSDAKLHPPFSICVADESPWADDPGATTQNGSITIPGNRLMAENLVTFVNGRGFDLGKVEEMTLHPTILPIGPRAAGRSPSPVITLLVNPHVTAARPLSRFVDLGAAIGKFFRTSADAQAGVAVCGVGGSEGDRADALASPFAPAADLFGGLADASSLDRNTIAMGELTARAGDTAPAIVNWLIVMAIAGKSPHTELAKTESFCAIEFGP
ncbi:MAG: hypothetical protein O7C63_10165 [Alphaproteobacteria bacterium]|nr:hypothetical protein [Alphaproteobacteria bacterium]